jgi:hypothetical protein
MSSILTTTGWMFSSIVSAIFVLGAYTQFTFDPADELNQSTAQFPDWLHAWTAISLLVAAFLHMMPYPSVAMLGTIIMTGMIGGMIATLLLQENSLWWTRAIMGLLPWLGLYLRIPMFNDLMSFWR